MKCKPYKLKNFAIIAWCETHKKFEYIKDMKTTA